jgi:hypothetical protein
VLNHPQFRDDLAYHLAVAEEANHRTLGDHNAYSLGYGAHVGGCEVPAAQAHWHIHLRGEGVEITARRENYPTVAHHKSPIQLREFIDGAAQIWIANVSRRFRVPS